MGGDSRSDGWRFASHHSILDGDFFTLICCENCKACLNMTENKQNAAGDGPFLKKYYF